MKVIATLMLTVTILAPLPALGQDNPATSNNIHLAALQGDIEAIRQHIESGSDLNAKDAYGSTPLIVAATFGKTEVAKALIAAGADLDMKNRDGGTALHAAAFLCRSEIVEALLEHGADKYLRDGFGNTPFETVSASFEDVKDIYDGFARALRPLGLQLDYERITATRPRIAEMLRPRANELEAAEYAPLIGDDWRVSTPDEQGLDPTLVAELFLDATGLETLYGLLVVKNGFLIAEGYFNDGAVEQKALLQSATKSYTSALVGIALERGCLSNVDQRMVEFFPEFAGQLTDPRKEQITIRHMLQMRDGYPWEESDLTLWDALLTGEYLSRIEEFPLTRAPGTEFQYSNLTSHWLGVIVARACGTDLRSFGQEFLFTPLGVEVGEWTQDRDGYHIGGAEIRSTARDAAKFGLLYLNDGRHDGKQVVAADWVRESLLQYSEAVSSGGIQAGELGRYFGDIGYGYQWWSARVGEHHVNYAAGHGGQLIILLDEFDMVVVVTADPFFLQHDDESWMHEVANYNLVGKFIQALPTR